MIFASDLDRTLLYSRRSMGPISPDILLQCVDRKNGQDVVFMTSKAIDLLETVNQHCTFIPVTTRTEQEFKRIFLFDRIETKFAITNNGGKIFADGHLVTEWSQILTDRLQHDGLAKEEVQHHFASIMHPDWVGRSFDTGEFLMYHILPSHLPEVEVALFSDFLQKNGWVMSVQDRKLYLVPACLSKQTALSYVEQLIDDEVICAAGDSNLDLPMLEHARQALLPAHATIKVDLPQMFVTQSKGIRAAEEILTQVLTMVSATVV